MDYRRLGTLEWASTYLPIEGSQDVESKAIPSDGEVWRTILLHVRLR